MVIGVLSLQGNFAEHIEALNRNNIVAKKIKSIHDLNDCDFLILPGGESTTIGKLLKITGLDLEIRKRFESGSLKIWGTCAGAILCAKNVITDNPVLNLALADYTIVRNAYGNQLESFETELSLKLQNGNQIKIDCAFIRAPLIQSLNNDNWQILASFKNNPIFAVNGNLMISTCHPELYQNSEFYTCLREGQFFGNFSNL